MEKRNTCLIMVIIVLNIEVISVIGEEEKFIIEPYGPYKNYTAVKHANPRDNTPGSEYDYFNFISSVRMNEWNLVSPDRKCKGRCIIYWNQTYLHKNESKNAINKTDYCPGRLYLCKLYKEPEQTRTMAEVKRMIEPFGRTEEERYDAWLKYMKSLCATCVCYCDNSEDENKTSSICLDSVSSRTSDGFVIAGVRLKMNNKMVKIQYQEAKITDDNLIDLITLSDWLENSGCNNVSKMSYGHLSFQIDDILLPPRSVVTGLSFAKDAQFRRFHLVVYGKDIKSIKNNSVIPTKYSKPVTKRKNLMTSDMDIPTTAPIANVTELSEPDKYYVTFQPIVLTNDETKVDEQVMPFIDIRKLSVPQELMKPFCGLGIYWRSCEGYGGYLAFKLIIANHPIDIKKYLKQLTEMGIIHRKT